VHIDLNDRFERCKARNYAFMTIDGTDMPIYETYPFDPALYSYKLNGPGLRYEIAVCIATGQIVWINGPYKPTQWVDITIFRHKLMWKLLEGEWVVGDGGYSDGNQFVVPKRTGPVWLQEMTAMATVRHETINSRMKVWTILRNSYKYGKGTDEQMRRHGQTVKAIANVVNIWLTESPPFPCHYDDSDCM
jgi:DDE superfamily endonuclease